MTEYNFNFKNSIFTKQAIKAAREKAIKKDIQDSTASSNEVKNLLEQKCDNAGIFRDLTDEEVEARLKSEKQSPLSLIKNLIGAYKKDFSGVNFATNQRNDLNEIDSSGVLPPQNDAFRHTEQSEVSQSIQGDGEILRHFVPQNDVLPTAGAMEDSETVLIPVENRANATSSLTIKDADGAKPQTLAAGDKLNVTYVYEGETFNYTIEAKSAQNVTLQTKDGYFTVVGDNLAVQTDDEQYSFVALIGTSNSIKIGTNGKTYNGNSIAYNSDEGGHSIYTWGDDPTPGPGPDDPVDPDLTLGRAGSGSEFSSSGSFTLAPGEEKVLCLKNPFTGKDYTYTVKIRDDIESDSPFYQRATASFDFIANGRLVIRGNYLNITAGSGQQDDIILLTNHSILTTGNEDDIIRLGYVKDSPGKYYYQPSATNADEYGYTTSKYSTEELHYDMGICCDSSTEPFQFAYCTIGNHIYSGDGSDHVTMLLNRGDELSTVNMGTRSGDFDTFETINGSHTLDALFYHYEDSKMAQLGNLIGADIARSKFEHDSLDLDTEDGWVTQAGGACLTLSLLNSLSHGKNHYDLSQIATIEPQEDGIHYDVNFKFTPNSGEKTKTTVTVDSHIYTYGDLDSTILINGFVQLACENNPSWATNTSIQNIVNRLTLLGYIGNYQKALLSRYLFNNAGYIDTKYVKNLGTDAESSRTAFLNLVSHYLAENGDLSNIVGAFTVPDLSLGRIKEHAYTIRDVAQNPQTGEWYVELVNPWDDRDCVRYSLDYIMNSDFSIRIYGCSEAKYNACINAPFQG